jgi:hypothetical protein
MYIFETYLRLRHTDITLRAQIVTNSQSFIYIIIVIAYY